MKLLVAMAVFLSLSCQKEPVSEDKFMTFDQEDKDYAENFAKNLVERVHYDSWTIAYGFYNNDDVTCASEYSGYHDDIKKKVEVALLKWLSPLADKENLIGASGFKFTNPNVTGVSQEDVDGYTLSWHGKFVVEEQFDLGIIFYCGAGERPRSSMVDPEAYTYLLVHMLPYKPHARKHNKDKYGAPELTEDAFLTPNGKYRKFTLLHELGHTFGLADVYGGQTHIGETGPTVSTGGNRITVGSQPLSIMSSNEFWRVMGFPSDVELTRDDEEGIRWLYSYHHGGQGDLKSCPAGYKFEERAITYQHTPETCTASTTTGITTCKKEESIEETLDLAHGCVPLYPLIFSVKQGKLRVLKNILSEDCKTDINEQDESGNTPLHYAVMREERHSGDICHYLINNGADHTLRNNQKQTPYDLFPSSDCLKGVGSSPKVTVRQVDVNGDCKIDVFDLAATACIIANNNGSCPNTLISRTDINRDKVVDKVDLDIISTFFGQTVSSE